MYINQPMKSLPVLIVLICLVRLSYGQQLITDEGVQLKPGIYRDFYEFKYNRPSIKFDYTVFPPGPPTYSYTINISNQTVKAIGAIYGFCDGKDVYLSYSRSPGVPFTYGKVSYLGRYCIYWFTVMRTLPVSVTEYFYMPIPLGTSDLAAIVDMNTGQKYGLSRKIVEYLIEDDPEIHNRYLSDEKDRENLEAYLVEYSVSANTSQIDQSAKIYIDQPIFLRTNPATCRKLTGLVWSWPPATCLIINPFFIWKSK